MRPTPLPSLPAGRRLDRLAPASPPIETMNTYQQPDASGHFGIYGGTFASETLTHAIEDRLSAVPGIEATAMAISLPMQGGVDLPFRVEGRALPGDSPYHGDEQLRSITPAYFKALSTSTLRGRASADRLGSLRRC